MKLAYDDNCRTLIMGIVNVTPDSFYPASRVEASEAERRAAAMIAEGADIIDIGGESTRPGAAAASAEQELAAVIPAIETISAAHPDVMISVDTRKAVVAREALRAGASMINDVSGLELPNESAQMLDLLRESEAAYVLMHTRGTPDVMQNNIEYADFWGEMDAFFRDKLALLECAGVPLGRVIVDPGIGFGKTREHNLAILANLPRLKAFGHPIMIGASRKGFIGGALGGLDEENRLEGTLAVSSLCAWNEVDIVRVHDVNANRRAVRMIEAIKNVKLL